MGSKWQSIESYPVLLELFGYLELQGLGRAVQVCRLWSEVVRYDGLWHRLARHRWNINGDLPEGQTSWREEVKRLIHHVPLIQSEEIYHRDEILHVSISHDGRYIATTSKDTSVVLWRLGNREMPLSLCGSINISIHWHWTTAHSSAFNKSDSLLLVAGVKDRQEYCKGKGVVLTVPDMIVIMGVSLYPNTWLTDRIVTGCKNDIVSDVAKIQVCEVEDRNIRNAQNTRAERFLVHKDGRPLFSYKPRLCHHIIVALVPDVGTNGTHRDAIPSVVKMDTDSSEEELVAEEDSREVTCRLDAAKGSRTSDQVLSVEIKRPTDSTSSANWSLEAGKRTYIVMVTGIHDIIGIQEVKQAELDVVMRGNTPRPLLERFDHQLHLENCNITGLCLSHDHRYLYFNHRELDESVEDNHFQADFDRIFKQNLKIGTFDLTTMTHLRNIEYTGHLAFSFRPVRYNCIGTSKDFIGSGSEDAKAYIWDRHHRVMLGTLCHQEGVLNGITFSPVDQEVCVTVCDDKLVKIWKSRNRMANIVTAQCDE